MEKLPTPGASSRQSSAGASSAQTEPIRAEEALRHVITSARCLVWHAAVTAVGDDLEWDIRISNEAAAWRWLPIEKRAGQPFADCWNEAKSPLDRVRMDENSTAAIRSGQSRYSQEFRCRLSGGEWRWLLEDVHIEPLGPGSWRLVGVCTDITRHKQMEEAVREERDFLNAVCDTAATLIVVLDSEGRVVRFNRACEQITGYTFEEVWGQYFWDLFLRPEEKGAVQAVFQELTAGQFPNRHENFWRTREGEPRLIVWSNTGLIGPDGKVRYIIGSGIDVTEQRRAEQALVEERTLLRTLIDNLPDLIYIKDAQSRFVINNVAHARLLGATPEALIGNVDFQYFPEELAARYYADEQEIVRTGVPLIGHQEPVMPVGGGLRWFSTTKVPLRDQNGAIVGLVGMGRDITAEKAQETEREQMLVEAMERADRDPLTGLLNHRAFHKRLNEEADRAQREGGTLAILVMDLDNFKFFNDAYGHAAGDDVLEKVAETLRRCCRTYDTLARFGGDEFAMLVPGTGTAEAAQLASRLCASVGEMGYLPPGGDVPIPLGLSVGAAVFPEEGATRLDVLELADARLLRAKSGGRREEEEADRLCTQLARHREGFAMLNALVSAVDNKDRYTRRHSEDVLTYSLQIARQLDLDEKTQQDVAVAALLHDVGKIAVPDHILRKPGRLTDAEFEAVKQHPMMGAIMVAAVPGFESVLDAIRHHHERWDGKGYPFGLRGEETPLLARLMAVADAYSAMTTDRPYRKGMNTAQALAVLEKGLGTQWDPRCVRAFLCARALSTPLLPATASRV